MPKLRSSEVHVKRSGPPKRRTPLKAKRQLPRDRVVIPAASAKGRKRLRARSKKAEAAAEARRDVVMAVRARDRYCVAEKAWPDVACGGTSDVHEPLPRSRGGDPLDPDQCVLLCRRHHDAVHGHPARARGLGLLR